MRESGCACFERLNQTLARSVGVAKAHLDAERNSVGDGRNGLRAFGRDREEERIVAGGLTQLVDAFAFRVEHHCRIMRAAKPRFCRKEWAFDMPPGNCSAKVIGLRTQFAKMIEAAQHRWPMVGNQCEEKARATC